MNMREKMARAMFDKGWKTGPLTWNAAGDGTRAEMYELADAALDALMKPTDAIKAAGCNDEPPCIETYYDMIRAIKEGK